MSFDPKLPIGRRTTLRGTRFATRCSAPSWHHAARGTHAAGRGHYQGRLDQATMNVNHLYYYSRSLTLLVMVGCAALGQHRPRGRDDEHGLTADIIELRGA